MLGLLALVANLSFAGDSYAGKQNVPTAKSENSVNQIAMTSANDAAIRINPKATAKTILVLKKGTTITLVNYTTWKDWYYVKYKNRKGWMHKNFIEFGRRQGVLTQIGKPHWYRVAVETNNGFLISKSKILIEGDLRTFWVRSVDLEDESVTAQSLLKVNCKEFTNKLISISVYGKDGNLKETTKYNKGFTNISPESVNYYLATNVCKVVLDPPLKERPKPKPKTISGGVVNGKATSLPKPDYPAAAKAVGAKGSVSVLVLIDVNGNVISASARSGHPLLRASAVAAAKRAKFRPTRLSGQPVKVSGVLTYVFPP